MMCFVYILANQHHGTLYVGSTTGNVEEAVKVISEQLGRIREEPVTEEELQRTKEQLKSATILAGRN